MVTTVRKFLVICGILVTALAIGAVFLEMSQNVYEDRDNWVDEIFDLKINENSYGETDLKYDHLPNVKAGDKIELSKELDDSYSGKTLVFRAYNCAVDVFLSNERIYSQGRDSIGTTELLARGYHLIDLSRKVENKSKLIIKLEVGEDMSYHWVDFFKSTSSNSVWFDILNQNVISIYLSLLLLMIGILGFLGSLVVFFVTKNNNLHLLYSFETAFFIGLWNSCTNGFFQMVTSNYGLTSFLEYAALYISVLFYISTIGVIKEHTRFNKTLIRMKYLYLVFLCIVFILHYSNICPITQTVTVFRFVGILVIATIFFIVISDYESQKKFEKALSISNIIGMILIATHTILLNLNIPCIEIAGREIVLDNTFTSVAILIVIITPLLSYALKVSEMGVYETQLNLLRNIAHKDQLTGLNNRYGGMAFVMELKKYNIPYIAIMYDLNSLKFVNDTYGHSRGDKLITDFSGCLQKLFNTENSINIRQGGDEFVTIVKSAEIEAVEESIVKLQEYVDDINRNNNDNCLSVAVGIASSKELDDDSYENVLKLADDRMYENKLSIKKKS